MQHPRYEIANVGLGISVSAVLIAALFGGLGFYEDILNGPNAKSSDLYRTGLFFMSLGLGVLAMSVRRANE